MGNPLFDQFNNQNKFSNIIQQAQELRKNINGDPKQIVQSLLNSGQVSQSEFNALMPLAQQIAAMMPKK